MIDIEFYLTELQKLLPRWDGCRILQQKDGVTVARVQTDNGPVILKAFKRAEYRREISNYALLRSLNIPTPRVIASTDAALLMEDLQESRFWRLGVEADMADPRVAKRLAQWYRALHNNGAAHVAQHGCGLYDESDLFTRENLLAVLYRSGAQNLPVWRLLNDHFSDIRAAVNSLPRTLCYNDFYYTNFAVAQDFSAAMMFDYNLLGKGYRYNDIGNVLASLSPEAGKTFLAEYGEFDPREKLLHDVISVSITLHMAYQREIFPNWAQESLQRLQSSGYLNAIESLLSI